MSQYHTFCELGKAKQRDIFRAWVTGRCEYYSNSGEWMKLHPPAPDNASYLGSTKYYRIKEPSK